MFKPLLVASLTLSSLAMAEPGHLPQGYELHDSGARVSDAYRPHDELVRVPDAYRPHDELVRVPDAYRPHDELVRVPDAYRPGEAAFPRPAQEGPSFGHDRPWSEAQAPSFGHERRDDRLDARRANQLLRDYDAALARRDFRAARATEWSFSAFLEQQLREARTHGGERQLGRLSSIAADLTRLERRMDPRALMARRGLYADLAQLASREVRGGWRA